MVDYNPYVQNYLKININDEWKQENNNLKILQLRSGRYWKDVRIWKRWTVQPESSICVILLWEQAAVIASYWMAKTWLGNPLSCLKNQRTEPKQPKIWRKKMRKLLKKNFKDRKKVYTKLALVFFFFFFGYGGSFDCEQGLLSSCGKWDYSVLTVWRLLIAVASPVAEHTL